MSLRYCHTLIPRSPEFVPTAGQVQAFLAAMIQWGVLGGEPSLVMRTPSARVRRGLNPFTRQLEEYPMTDHTDLPDVNRVADVIKGRADYEVQASGMGRPEHPPLPLAFGGPYHVGIVCHVSSRLRSTSDPHDEVGEWPGVPFFGDPCEAVIERGIFCNPHTMEVIEVAGGGCARFWVEFELGKWLFPAFERGDLELLDPAIVAGAERLFGIGFAQGCNWG
jgi:hypothetical protein